MASNPSGHVIALRRQAMGDVVRTRRQELELTTAQLAERSDVDQGGIEEIERGERSDPPKRGPDHDALAGLAQGLGWSVDELLSAHRGRLGELTHGG